MRTPGEIVDICAGYGGLSMGLSAVTGARVSAYAEVDPNALRILAAHHPGATNLGDVKAMDWRAASGARWMCAGYPCQPWSAAGRKLGTADPRHLWPWIARGVGIAAPEFVLLENVLGHVRLGLPQVLDDLTALGYGGAWAVTTAMGVGAPHRRRRVFVLASLHVAPGFREVVSFDRPELANRYALLPTPQARDGKGQPSHAGFNVANLPRAVLALPDDGSLGEYAPAAEHWAHVIGRPAPVPTVPNGRGGRRLNPAFAEWMMGVTPGRVTDYVTHVHDVNRLTGNGVVPLQASHAVGVLFRALSPFLEIGA